VEKKELASMTCPGIKANRARFRDYNYQSPVQGLKLTDSGSGIKANRARFRD